MNRRTFLNTMAATGAALSVEAAETDGHTLVCTFKQDGVDWQVYEDLRTRDGALTFTSARGRRVLAKSAEAAFSESNPPYLGLNLAEIGTSGRDLLAEK